MKFSAENLRHLLGDVIPPLEGRCGPSRAAVLKMARHERARRQQARVILSIAAAALLALPFLWRSAPNQEPTVAVAPVASRHIGIQQVDDQQLLVLLKDTPAALMEWPDGRRTLLVMER